MRYTYTYLRGDDRETQPASRIGTSKRHCMMTARLTSMREETPVVLFRRPSGPNNEPWTFFKALGL